MLLKYEIAHVVTQQYTCQATFWTPRILKNNSTKLMAKHDIKYNIKEKNKWNAHRDEIRKRKCGSTDHSLRKL